MLPPLSAVSSAATASASLVAIRVYARRAMPRASVSRAGRAFFFLTCAAVIASHLAWSYGVALGSFAASYWGCNVSLVVTVMLGLAAASTVVTALAYGAGRASNRLVTLVRPLAPSASPPVISRRAFIEGAAAAAPALGAGIGVLGFETGAARPRAPTRVLACRDLPAALDGLRVLQLSDLHLGAGRSLSDLERFFATLEARGARPDLIVLTGDVAEDVRLLGPALDLVRQVRAPLGAFAALGNHEHIHGVRAARRLFDASAVRLLVDDAVLVDVRGAPLAIVGVDDPIVVHREVRSLLRGPIEKAVARVPRSDAFRLLLCHRPEGFEHAAANGCAVTLAGHTHGGQIGFAGKSAFEPLYPDGYLWGAYQRGDAHLYTTSGFGAWFPFRLGCPSEAPLLELRAAP